MSNTKSNSTSVADIYAQIVDIKKRQLELVFMPSQNREKNHPSIARNLRANLATLQRAMVQARAGKHVEMPTLAALEKKKRGKK